MWACLAFFGILAVCVVFIVCSNDRDNTKTKDALELVDEISRFIGYLDVHKRELPENIKERYEELEDYVKNKLGDN